MSVASFLMRVSFGSWEKPNRVSDARWSGMLKWFSARMEEGITLEQLVDESFGR